MQTALVTCDQKAYKPKPFLNEPGMICIASSACRGVSHMGVGVSASSLTFLSRFCTISVQWNLPQLSALEVSTRSPTQPIFSRLSSLTRAYSSNSRKT